MGLFGAETARIASLVNRASRVAAGPDPTKEFMLMDELRSQTVRRRNRDPIRWLPGQSARAPPDLPIFGGSSCLLRCRNWLKLPFAMLFRLPLFGSCCLCSYRLWTLIVRCRAVCWPVVDVQPDDCVLSPRLLEPPPPNGRNTKGSPTPVTPHTPRSDRPRLSQCPTVDDATYQRGRTPSSPPSQKYRQSPYSNTRHETLAALLQ